MQLKSYIKKWLISQILQLFTQQNGWKKKLIEKYDDHVFFAEMKEKSDVVCLKSLADLNVNNSCYETREKDLAKESERIINTAAKLILSDIED